jgi:hypothetical protein
MRILFAVLSAIDLDDEPCLGAEEIDDVGSKRVLTPEAKSFELFTAQPRP